ncbi:dTDP-4-dehydrorhamnose reductase [Roseitranquillus sediminis]|uniref:dTDP-4-dehydrorhamnose reductase n=1 Tax=Roseitranquillus sediminis TaxID=2809051 RepID=UPI001D0CC028|nr:dTDP-4-dehydrorhamnose reductase [Roseitranquillus sediminis]MBM9593907.1 dTDP-4-dehydrorhamnose reductase [Roseitranquillus sediminis]
MRLLVFGRTGQVATELARIAPEAVFLGREQADLADPAAGARAVAAAEVDAVVNAAAWTAVDAAEDNREAAFAANGAAPAAMAEACAARGLPFVQISTDYVFDGSGDRPWAPEDATGPLGAYGASKLAGEEGVRAAGGTHAILRTSWVFSAHGSNFVKTMLRLGAERDGLRIVTDQVGGPTPAADIARACLTIARGLADEPARTGTYHYSGAPDVSWAGFARAIFAAAGLAVEVTEIPTADYPTPAPRPLNSRLDCAATEAVFGLARPDWRAGLEAVLAELRGRTPG